jgi:hypothetical protein
MQSTFYLMQLLHVIKSLTNQTFIIFMAFAVCQCKKNETLSFDSNEPGEVTSSDSRPLAKTPPTPEKPPEPPQPKPEVIPQSPALQKELRSAVNRWNELPSQFSGKDLITKQRELAYEALEKLAGGVELAQFLQFLKNKGAADLCQEIIDGGMVDLFRGEKGEAMRNWVLSVEDFALKEQLMLQAGMAYDGKDLAAFFERIGTYPNGHNSQCRFMTGYCSTMAKTDPLGAMKFYGEMCHPKKITNAGLEKVMEYVQPNADYLAIATVIKEDNAGLSKNTRRSLLNNWSQHKPAEAAQYVMSNTSVVHADQMAVVMKQWAQQDPDQAAAWIAGWDGSDHKDQGCLILAQTMKLAKPADAFVMASHISNFELKVKTATEAFNEWAKIDRKAAEAAWVQVFPQ